MTNTEKKLLNDAIGYLLDRYERHDPREYFRDDEVAKINDTLAVYDNDRTFGYCPHCEGLNFTIAESYTYKAVSDPNSCELSCDNSPKSGGYVSVTCDQCNTEYEPTKFNII